MRSLIICVALLATAVTHAAETVTVGGAAVTIAKGWVRNDAGGNVVLTPTDLPPGVICSLTLLGGEPFEGSLRDRLAADWRQLILAGNLKWDDNGRLEGRGTAVPSASRAGTFEHEGGEELHVWLVILQPKDRIERMLFAASTREAFERHVPAVAEMVNGARFVAVASPPPQKPIRQSTGAFGHARYTTPSGWTEQRYSGAVVFSPTEMPADEHLQLRLLTPAPASGTLAGALERTWMELCDQLGATTTRTVYNASYDSRPPRKSFKGWEYARATGIITAKADGSDYTVDLLVMKVNQRFERMAVIGLMRNHNLSRYSLYDSPVHRQTLQEFMFSIEFDDCNDPDVKPAGIKGDGIIGVWQGISMFGGKFKAAYAIFYSNGQAYFGSRFPLQGCDRQNSWLEAEQTPSYWGVYHFEGDSGAITMPYGQIPLASRGSKLVLTTNGTEHSFVRVPPVDGARFDGTYVMDETYETKPVITFKRDGRFQDKGALKVLEHDFNNIFAVAPAMGAGTYSVENHTITFRYSDGKVLRIAYPGADHEPNDGSPAQLKLSFNEDVLTRR